MKRVLQAVFLLLLVGAWIQAGWQHSRLPARVASHFNAAGHANGWMTRDAQFGWQVGPVTFLAFIFFGISWLQPRLPREFVNLPHRDFWLAPERRAATDAWISGLLFACGSLVMAFLIYLFHLVYCANLTANPRLPAGFGAAGILLVLLLIGMVLTVVFRFARTPPA